VSQNLHRQMTVEDLVLLHPLSLIKIILVVLALTVEEFEVVI
jgi:hypothetical protein